MKTGNSAAGDPIWTTNVDILPQDECLPIIGSCQVSSILQNLDSTENEGCHQNMDLIILPPSDLKLPIENAFSLQNSYVILKDKSVTTPEKLKSSNHVRSPEDNFKKKQEDFEDMLYFVCDLCPFLCTKDQKITEHLENAHKNKTTIKLTQLKCPACPNIFYHKMSLRSHLIHDHGVGNSDLSQIIQAVIYYSNKSKSKEKQKVKGKETVVVKPVEPERIENVSSNDTDDSKSFGEYEEPPVQKPDSKTVVLLPQVDLMHKNSEKIYNSLSKPPDPVTKCLDAKKSNKCVVPSCNVRLQDMDKMNYHINCHMESGFECQDCGEKFVFWKPLASHLWRFHKIDMDLFSCDKCDYKSYSLAKLNNIHKLIHSEVRGFSCNVCSKAFKNSKQLRNHKITHKDKTEKLMHTCEVCTKNFTGRKQLRVHMDVVHKQIRPFLCSYCGYKGSSRSSLKMHVRQHTGEKPFSCSYCPYTSSDHNSLRRHKLRHTGQKPYKCSYCTYACIQSSTYKTHLKTKHPGLEKDLMFACRECQFRSVNKEMFTSHMITVHKTKPQEEV